MLCICAGAADVLWAITCTQFHGASPRIPTKNTRTDSKRCTNEITRSTCQAEGDFVPRH